MITLRFVPDDEEMALFRRIEADNAAELGRPLAEWLRSYPLPYEPHLVMPTRLTVHGVDLFSCGGSAHVKITDAGMDLTERLLPGHEPCPWTSLPLGCMGFSAVSCLRHLREWRRCEICRIRGGHALIIALKDGDRVELSSILSGKSAEARLDEVLAAFETFSQSVSDYLREALPELAKNDLVGPWIRRGPKAIH